MKVEYTEDDLLYLNNIGRKSYQWEIWQCCNQLCKYCYLGKDNRHTDKEVQLKSLREFAKAIQTLDYTEFNNISIIGGEMFQGQMNDPEVYAGWMECMNLIADKYLEKKIGSIWITTTMTIGDNKHLYDTLDLFEKRGVRPNPNYQTSGLWICTSWDAEGRFYTPDRLPNWEFHMLNIHEKYPWVKFNTTIILMDKFLDMYLNDEFKPKEFMKKFHTTLFYKQCGVPSFDMMDPMEIRALWLKMKEDSNKAMGFNFFPPREKFLRFLEKYAIQDRETYDKLYNIRYRADSLLRHFNDSNTALMLRNKNAKQESNVPIEGTTNTCGHLLNYAGYVDTNDCCVCDRERIYESIYGISQYDDTFGVSLQDLED